jgi:hypothetical protein
MSTPAPAAGRLLAGLRTATDALSAGDVSTAASALAEVEAICVASAATCTPPAWRRQSAPARGC